MLQIAVPSVLQQSTVSIGMMIVQAVVNPFGTQALAGVPDLLFQKFPVFHFQMLSPCDHSSFFQV